MIGGNGSQGVLIEPGASGNQVSGNQIGVDRAHRSSGFISTAGNGADGVVDRIVGHGGQSRGHRLCVEQRHRRRVAGRATSSRRTTATEFTSIGVGHAKSGRGQLYRCGPRRRLRLRQRPARQLSRRRADRRRTRQPGRRAGVSRRQRDLVEQGSWRLHHRRRCARQHGRKQHHRPDLRRHRRARQRPGRSGRLLARHADRPGQRHLGQPDRRLDLGCDGDRRDRPTTT